MKYLQRLLALFVVSAAIFSCQKEYSVENNGNNPAVTAQWEFKEGGVQFKGPIDTVSIDTITGYKFLTINGRSADGSTQFTLQAFGADLKVGTYKTPFSLFAYIKGATPIYQTDQSAADSFTIVITRVDASGVAGTFSGRALSGTAGKTIVDGKFSATIKGSTTPPATTDSGQVVLWSKAGCGGGTSTNPIAVSIAGKSGQITSFVATEPTTCDPAGAFHVKLPVGTYGWVAKCGTDSVTGSVTVTKDGCTKQQVDFTAAAATGDYFPMTASSNWSYLYDGSTPDDTLYTLSTGKSSVMGGKTYNWFTNSDGVSKDTSYYRKEGNAYYQYSAASTSTDSTTGLVISLPAFEYSFLVDNVAANNTFTNGPYTGTATLGTNSAPFSVSNKTTVLATGASVTIGTLSYTNVIKVKTIYSSTLGGVTNEVYGVEQWFAKGVGLIKFVDYDTAPFATPAYTLNITRAKVY